MNSIDFCFWLQGYYELNSTNTGITEEQSKIIEKHLKLVFVHQIDPLRDKETPDLVEKMNNIHNNDNLMRC